MPAFYSTDLPTKSGIDGKRVPPFFGSYAESISRAASPGTESSSQRTPPHRLFRDELSSSKSTTTSIEATHAPMTSCRYRSCRTSPSGLSCSSRQSCLLISSRRFARGPSSAQAALPTSRASSPRLRRSVTFASPYVSDSLWSHPRCDSLWRCCVAAAADFAALGERHELEMMKVRGDRVGGRGRRSDAHRRQRLRYSAHRVDRIQFYRASTLRAALA